MSLSDKVISAREKHTGTIDGGLLIELERAIPDDTLEISPPADRKRAAFINAVRVLNDSAKG